MPVVRSRDSALAHSSPSNIEAVPSTPPFIEEKEKVSASRRSPRLQGRKKFSGNEQKAIAIGFGVPVEFGFMLFVCLSLSGRKRIKDPKNSNKGRRANLPQQSSERFIHGEDRETSTSLGQFSDIPSRHNSMQRWGLLLTYFFTFPSYYWQPHVLSQPRWFLGKIVKRFKDNFRRSYHALRNVLSGVICICGNHGMRTTPENRITQSTRIEEDYGDTKAAPKSGRKESRWEKKERKREKRKQKRQDRMWAKEQKMRRKWMKKLARDNEKIRRKHKKNNRKFAARDRYQ
ncbi:hypothetical protein DL98DRAFT_534501 [Cadophora sp. DSE1049]|nr:hypothetical protein DL98DRAFT_534501 [Cadophora sp. DSE1049]